MLPRDYLNYVNKKPKELDLEKLNNVGFTINELAIIDIINLFLYIMVALKVMSFMRMVPLLAQFEHLIGQAVSDSLPFAGFFFFWNYFFG